MPLDNEHIILIEKINGSIQSNDDRNVELLFDSVDFTPEYNKQFAESLSTIPVKYNLVFSNCQLDQFDCTDSSPLLHVSSVTIQDSQLKDIPSGFKMFKNIQRLIYSDMNDAGLLRNIDGAIISEFKQLIHLEICGHRIETIPNEIAQLKALKACNMSHNMIHQIPRVFGSLQSLSILRLSSNKISFVDPSIVNLRNLTELYLDHNMIRVIPNEIACMGSLKVLNISHNELVTFIKRIGSMKSLCKLYLNDNAQLAIIPDDMENLPNLDEFLYHNTLISDSSSSTIVNILEEDEDANKDELLDFSNREFDKEMLKEILFAIRATIHHMRKDFEADFSHNRLESLPDNFGVLLKDVTSLHMSYNSQFKDFGGQLLHLTKLKWLYVDGIVFNDGSIGELTKFVENSKTISQIVGLDIRAVKMAKKIDFVNAVAKNQAKNADGIKRINGMAGSASYPLALRVLDKIGTIDNSRHKKLIEAYDRSVCARKLHRRAAEVSNKVNIALNILTVFVSFAVTVISFAIDDQLIQGSIAAISTLLISIATKLELSKKYASHKYAAKVYDNLATSIDFQLSYPTKDMQQFAHEVEKTMIEINNDTEYFPKLESDHGHDNDNDCSLSSHRNKNKTIGTNTRILKSNQFDTHNIELTLKDQMVETKSLDLVSI